MWSSGARPVVCRLVRKVWLITSGRKEGAVVPRLRGREEGTVLGHVRRTGSGGGVRAPSSAGILASVLREADPLPWGHVEQLGVLCF